MIDARGMQGRSWCGRRPRQMDVARLPTTPSHGIRNSVLRVCTLSVSSCFSHFASLSDSPRRTSSTRFRGRSVGHSNSPCGDDRRPRRRRRIREEREKERFPFESVSRLYSVLRVLTYLASYLAIGNQVEDQISRRLCSGN